MFGVLQRNKDSLKQSVNQWISDGDWHTTGYVFEGLSLEPNIPDNVRKHLTLDETRKLLFEMQKEGTVLHKKSPLIQSVPDVLVDRWLLPEQ